MNYAMAGYVASVTGTTSNTKYDISYDVDVSVTVSKEFDFPIKWRLYEVDSKSENAITCQKVTTHVEGQEIQYTQKCDEDETKLTSDKLIASGTLNKTDSCQANETGDKDRVSCGTSATHTITGKKADGVTYGTNKEKYYYLVVEYPTVPSEDQNQNSDMNKNITASVELKNVQTSSVPEQ